MALVASLDANSSAAASSVVPSPSARWTVPDCREGMTDPARTLCPQGQVGRFFTTSSFFAPDRDNVVQELFDIHIQRETRRMTQTSWATSTSTALMCLGGCGVDPHELSLEQRHLVDSCQPLFSEALTYQVKWITPLSIRPTNQPQQSYGGTSSATPITITGLRH